MTRHVRRKTEVVGLTNEQHFPHLVELAVRPEGLRDALLEFDAFHRERRIPVYRGRSRQVAERFHLRFCFPDAATADALSQSLRRAVLYLCTREAQTADFASVVGCTASEARGGLR
jgi:hypothetical protein